MLNIFVQHVRISQSIFKRCFECFEKKNIILRYFIDFIDISKMFKENDIFLSNKYY